MIDPGTIQRAYAANVDALKAMDEAVGTAHMAHRGLDGLHDLTGVLDEEVPLIDDLRQALRRQRSAVAEDDSGAIESSVQAIGRTLLTLDAARRRRGAIVALLACSPWVAVSDLDGYLGVDLPESLAPAPEAVRRAAADTALELTINQTILGRALEAGDAFLQELFSSTVDAVPVCRRHQRGVGPELPLTGGAR
jgi:hypothetical protein